MNSKANKPDSDFKERPVYDPESTGQRPIHSCGACNNLLAKEGKEFICLKLSTQKPPVKNPREPIYIKDIGKILSECPLPTTWEPVINRDGTYAVINSMK